MNLHIDNTTIPSSLIDYRDPEDYADNPLNAYSEWLFMELRLLNKELGVDHDGLFSACGTFAKDFHLPARRRWQDCEQPSARAVTVMRAAGVAFPQDAGAEPISTLAALLELAWAAHRAVDSENDEALCAASDVVCKLQTEILAAPAACAADIRAKLTVWQELMNDPCSILDHHADLFRQLSGELFMGFAKGWAP